QHSPPSLSDLHFTKSWVPQRLRKSLRSLAARSVATARPDPWESSPPTAQKKRGRLTAPALLSIRNLKLALLRRLVQVRRRRRAVDRMIQRRVQRRRLPVARRLRAAA